MNHLVQSVAFLDIYGMNEWSDFLVFYNKESIVDREFMYADPVDGRDSGFDSEETAVDERKIVDGDMDVRTFDHGNASSNRFGNTKMSSIYAGEIDKELLTAAEEIELGKQIESMRRVRACMEKAKNRLKELDAECGQDAEEIQRLTGEMEAYLALMPAFEAARNKLVEKNLRLVISIAKRYIGRALPLSDMIQDGNIGLMIAAEKYDWRLGHRFCTYATWWIRQNILRSLASYGSTVRLPDYLCQAIPRVLALRETFVLRTGRDPSYAELATLSRCKISVIKRILNISHVIFSLEWHPPEDEDATFKDILSDKDAGPEKACMEKQLEEDVDRVLRETLTPFSADIVKRRFGIGEYDDGVGQRLEEIAVECHRSHEGIRQRLVKSIDRLCKGNSRQRLKGHV